MSWPGDWDQTCVNEVHDTCHNYCDGVQKGKGVCVEWQAPDYDTKCADFELGVGLTCKIGNENRIPICNTGSKEAPAGIPIAIMPKGSGYFGTTPATLPGAKYCYTAEKIPPGECRNVTSCNVKNTDEIYVNAITNASYNSAECYPGDNWGFFYDDKCGYPPKCPGGYADSSKVENYESTCDSGKTPQWSYLSWDATVPASTEISFRVRTADTKAGLAAASWYSITTKATNANPDCKASGPSPCPIDLFKLLGKKDGRLKYLDLEASFKVDATQTKTATLESWQLSYTCLENK
jgi:hypothetical protein